MKQADRVIRFLIEGLKRKEFPTISWKYRKFEGSGSGSFYWVGKNGAVRVGETIFASASFTQTVYAGMHLWEKKEGL